VLDQRTTHNKTLALALRTALERGEHPTDPKTGREVLAVAWTPSTHPRAYMHPRAYPGSGVLTLGGVVRMTSKGSEVSR
jgi:hypothetical protein